MQYLPLCNDTLNGLLEYAARTYRSKIAVSMGSQCVTYAQLDESSKIIAKKLIEQGLAPGSHCALIGRNSIRWIVYFAALIRAGAVVVPLNPNETTEVLKDTMTRMRVSRVFAGTCHKETKDGFLTRIRTITEQIENDIGTMPLFMIEDTSFSQRSISASEETAEIVLPEPSSRQTAVIMMTSGTTGLAKGVMLSHGSLFNNAKSIAQHLYLTANDKMCLTVSLFHIFGLSGTLLSCLHSGCQVCIPEQYSTADIVATILRNQCTALNGVPTMFYNILQYCDQNHIRITGLQKGEIAGAVVGETAFRNIVKKLNMHALMTSYGMTETAPAVTFSTIDDSIEIRSRTVGKVLPHIRVRIRDIHTGVLLTENMSGEIEVSGYNVMQGYYNNPEATAETMTDDGWLRTGDIGFIDQDEYVTISGRKKELMIRGGENISPVEIERCILELPQVAQVKVFGVSDAKYQEEICACIVLKEKQQLTEYDVVHHVSNWMAQHKCPRYVVFFAEFPHTASGKVCLNELKNSVNLLATSECKRI